MDLKYPILYFFSVYNTPPFDLGTPRASDRQNTKITWLETCFALITSTSSFFRLFISKVAILKILK